MHNRITRSDALCAIECRNIGPIFAMALEAWESVIASLTTIQYIRIYIYVEARRICVVVLEYVGGTPVGDKEFLGV